mmetsp:Transcript_12265/g.20506  ORF Transcript_12265/g.20506 Transcript_12265/m.20506 type:complete len:393 (+) Transcript_12265:606-1784(+)
MKYFANVLVVVEDTFQFRYDMRHCFREETPSYTTFKCHNEPTFLLSRNCTNEYYGAKGPCCKVDDAFNYLVNEKRDTLFAHIKYLIHCDDDMYWRPLQVLRWMAALENTGTGNYPLIGNNQIGDPKPNGAWNVRNCKEIHTTGWYQPLFLSRAALQLLSVPSKAYALRDMCKNFDCTHDAGFGLLGWMLGLFHVKMPGTIINFRKEGLKALKPTDMAMHAVKLYRNETCAFFGKKKHPDAEYNQRMVIGCGDLHQPIPNHRPDLGMSMYDVHNWYKQNGVNITFDFKNHEFKDQFVVVNNITGKVVHRIWRWSKVATDKKTGTYYSDEVSKGVITPRGHFHLQENEYIDKIFAPVMQHLSGYQKTEHGKTHNITSKWVPYGMNDCNPKGSKG